MSATTIKRGVLGFFVFSLAALAGCSAKQGYVNLQLWQSQRCEKVTDRDERERCLEEADRSYEEYINSDEYKESRS